jgi:hypothetical protein
MTLKRVKRNTQQETYLTANLSTKNLTRTGFESNLGPHIILRQKNRYTKTIMLMLCMNTFSVYCAQHTEFVNTRKCVGLNAQLLNIKSVGT